MIRRLLFSCIFTVVIIGLGMVAFSSQQASTDFDRRIKELGHELPAVSKPLAIYKRVVVVDNIAFVSGHIPISAEGEIMTGKVGRDTDLQQAQAAAQRCAIGMLASLKGELG